MHASTCLPPRLGAVMAATVVAIALSSCAAGTLHPNGVVTLSAPGKASSAPARAVTLTTVRGPAAPATTVLAKAGCPTGMITSGGGIATNLVGGGKPPSSLHSDGSAPAGPTGKPPVSPGSRPAGWAALGATGGQIVLGGVTTAIAMCIHDQTLGSPVTIVTAAVPGPAVPTTTARATVSCPAGGWLVGGGGLTTVTHGDASPSLHLIGSYPSDSHGTPRPSVPAASWSALADAGGRTGSGVETITFAICAPASRARTEVVLASQPGPLPAGTATEATASCPSSTTLISGGARTSPASGPPQQGLHLTGSFPSDAGGIGAGFSPPATNANSWTARAESGGQGSPQGTVTTAFAVCLRP